MQNLNSFLDENKIKFRSQTQALRWVRKLKTRSLVRIGLSYFVDEKELSKLFEDDLLRRQKTRAKRAVAGKKLAEKNFPARRTSLVKKLQNDKDKAL